MNLTGDEALLQKHQNKTITLNDKRLKNGHDWRLDYSLLQCSWQGNLVTSVTLNIWQLELEGIIL